MRISLSKYLLNKNLNFDSLADKMTFQNIVQNRKFYFIFNFLEFRSDASRELFLTPHSAYLQASGT